MSGNNNQNEEVERFEEGKPNSHLSNDSKDQRSIKNQLAAQAHEDQKDDHKSIERKRLDEDATLPARAHGNEPSRGAKIDQQIREEEEVILKKMGPEKQL